MKRYLGVDLHRTQFVVCTRLENDQQEVTETRRADRIQQARVCAATRHIQRRDRNLGIPEVNCVSPL
jgi:hypothetical protein